LKETESIVSIMPMVRRLAMQASDHSEIEKKTKDELIKEIEDKKNNTILVAEDDTINRELILEQFKEAGFHSIFLAANGQEAVDMALKIAPDLILMDIRMPVMDGKTAIEKLKKKGYSGPIVILSGLSLQKDIDECIQAGAAGYITKPIDFYQFFLQIGKFLKVKMRKGKGNERVRAPGDQSLLQPWVTREHEYRITDGVSEKVRNVFLTDAQEKLAVINGILETNDFAQKRKIVERIAHGYVGNAVFLGLLVLEASAKELDQAFKDNAPLHTLINRTMELAAVLKQIIEENTNHSQSIIP
jgi:CheY-like chemotaxis protein